MEETQEIRTESLKKKTLLGTLWSALERFSTQGVSFIVMIIMARILTPADYGLVGMVLIFINVAQSLVDSGFSQALIRKKDRDETDNSTAFYFNIFVGVAIYLLIWFLSPAIARFYNEPRLVAITRVICISIIFNSLVVVQRALLTVNIDFKTQAKASLSGASVAGATGIAMAYCGFGVWSIVAYHCVNLGLNCVFLWLFSKWRPKLIYSWRSFHNLFGFGWKLAFSGLLHTMYLNAYNMVIGKVFKASDLGLYTRGEQFGKFFSSNLSSILQRVTYPVLCRFQDDTKRLGEVFTKFLRLTSFMIFALMMGLAGLAEPFIRILLGEKWMFSATIMQILCFALMWHSVYSINLNILLVKGRTDFYLILEIIKKIVFVGVLVATVPFGLIAMCWGQVLNSILEVIINSYFTGRYTGVGLMKQFRELLPALFYSFSMGAVVYIVANIMPTPWLQLIIGFLAGTVYFLFITYVTKSADLREAINLIRRKN